MVYSGGFSNLKQDNVGTGDVVGPGSSTDNALARFDSTTGKLLQDGIVTEDDSGNLASIGDLTMSGTLNVDSTTLQVDATNNQVGIGTVTPTQKLSVNGTMDLAEQAAAEGDNAGMGQIWVKDDTPNKLYFTDDAGTDYDLTSGGGLTWGDSISDTSGTGVTLTINDGASASTVAQKIAFGNAQTNNLVGLDVNLGTDGQGHTGIKIKTNATQQVGFDADFSAACSSNGGFRIDSYDSTTQNTSAVNTKSMVLGRNYNTNSSRYANLCFIYNQNNTGTGYNTGMTIENLSTAPRLPIETYKGDGVGLRIQQRGIGGTGLLVIGYSDIASNADGLSNFSLDDDQSSPSRLQVINTGTSAQDHTSIYMTGTRHSMYIGDTTAPSTKTNRLYSVSGNLTRNGGNVVKSTAGTPSGADSILEIVSLTSAEYAAISGSEVATTLYIITDA